MQTIPINLPASFFASFRRACSTFVWRGNKPRINYTRLTLPKNTGGIALPDLRKYHQAALMARIVDWNIHQQVKDWVSLEQIQFPQAIKSLYWIHPKHQPKIIRAHPLVGPTLDIFHNAFKINKTSPWCSPLTPLRNNTGHTRKSLPNTSLRMGNPYPETT